MVIVMVCAQASSVPAVACEVVTSRRSGSRPGSAPRALSWVLLTGAAVMVRVHAMTEDSPFV